MTRKSEIKKKLSVSAVIINDNGEVLLLRRASDREYNPDQWNIVAANVDDHSRAEDLISVEIYQETGLHGKILLPPVSWYVYFSEHETVYHDNTFLAILDKGEIRLDDEHTEYKWVNPKNLEGIDTVPFFIENLHQVGITDAEEPFKALYTNYKGETRWRYISPKKYHYGSNEYHSEEQWLVESYDHEKKAERTYALKDIHVLIPPNFSNN